MGDVEPVKLLIFERALLARIGYELFLGTAKNDVAASVNEGPLFNE